MTSNRDCVICGKAFTTPLRSPDAKTCGDVLCQIRNAQRKDEAARLRAKARQEKRKKCQVQQ